MEWATQVSVHESARPEAVEASILAALRRGEIHPSVLYNGRSQTLHWLRLHRQHSPLGDQDVQRIYQEAFACAVRNSSGNLLHIVSLGAGSGIKDTTLLKLSRDAGKAVLYTPCDQSLDMVLTAHRTATHAIRGLQCSPLVFDLLECTTMPGILKMLNPSGSERIVLFLGTLHNYSPTEALRAVLFSTRASDQLLVSANLAPEESYDSAVERILAQYNNELTRKWLLGAIAALGLGSEDGKMEITLNVGACGRKAVEARFHFSREAAIQAAGDFVKFKSGDSLLVFRSARFTPRSARQALQDAGLHVQNEWVSASSEEGVFLCRRSVREGSRPHHGGAATAAQAPT